MKSKVGVNVYAKMNFTLNVGDKIGDLHAIDSLVASVNVFDTVIVSDRLDDKINLAFDNDYGVDMQDNTVIKAINALRDDFGDFGVNVTVKKGIPFCGGMGGSSADAAGVIVALAALFDLDKRYIDYNKVCKKVGSDVLYMLSGGFARIGGTGDKVQKLSYDGDFCGVAIKAYGVNTKDVYKKFDEIGGTPTPSEKFYKQMKLGNMLTDAAISLNPQIAANIEALKKTGYSPNMTGSGSTVYAFCDDADEVAERLRSNGYDAFAFKTVQSGIQFI